MIKGISKVKYILLDPLRTIRSLKKRSYGLALYFLLPFFLHFFPNYLHFLLNRNLNYKEDLLVKYKDRLSFNKNLEEDFILKKPTKKIFDEINIIFRGDSLENYKSKINKKLPSFLVNMENKLNLKNFFLLTFDDGIKKNMITENLNPVIKIRNGKVLKNGDVKWEKICTPFTKFNKSEKKKFLLVNVLSKIGIAHKKETSCGSGILSIVLLGALSKTVNIYGWEYWLKKNIDQYSYFQSLFVLNSDNSLNSPENKYGKRIRKMTHRPRELAFSGAIHTWYYASRLSRIKKYKIFSRLKNINRQKKILSKIQKVFIK